MENISTWFWNEKFWLPEGISFEDIKSTEHETYAQPRDLLALPVFGFIVFILRHLFERFVSNPVAKRILSAEVKEIANGVEKNVVHSNGTGSNHVIYNNSVNAASKYAKRKQLKIKKFNDTMAKIAETSWKSIYHSFSFSFGMCILIQAPWFWDNRYCWIDFPRHPLWPSLYSYYMIEGAYYIALLLCLGTDVKRKDRKMMMIHHVGTINLIVFSYATNQTRIGSLLMVLHRLADMLLQIAKLLSYFKLKTIANYLFMIFVLTFLVTRLYIYPFYVMHTAIIKFMWYFEPYPWWSIGNCLAIGLQILHVLWAYIILKMAIKVLTKGPLDRDDRSGTEDEVSDDDTNKKRQ